MTGAAIYCSLKMYTLAGVTAERSKVGAAATSVAIASWHKNISTAAVCDANHIPQAVLY